MCKVLDKVNGPGDLCGLSMEELDQLACEVRELIQSVVNKNGGHLASNLGVVELTIALHRVFSPPSDKFTWDVGHQVYTHKILSGRKDRFETLRTYKGISGYPSPSESECDTFVSGHAGTSISTAIGLAVGLQKQGLEDHVVSVIGDAGIANGVALEAMNYAGELKPNVLLILNDNDMAISKTVGALSDYFVRLRASAYYNQIKQGVHKYLRGVPLVGKGMDRWGKSVKELVKRGLVAGKFFEDLGWRYLGPVDGHNIESLITDLEKVKKLKGPVILHVYTQKGRGYDPACEDPTSFHSASANFEQAYQISGKASNGDKSKASYTDIFCDSLVDLGREHSELVAITAAMTDGTGLNRWRDEFPERYYDVGIAESHAVAFGAGLMKTGFKPMMVIYSTFMQRAYDQVFHEMVLQPNPNAIICMDRAGLVGADGPTHHGAFDIAYMRHLPKSIVLAPGSGAEFQMMLKFMADNDGLFAVRYPKCNIPDEDAVCSAMPAPAKIEMGRGQWLKEGRDVVLIAYGSMVCTAFEAAGILEKDGISAGVFNGRFAKPIDENALLQSAAKYGLLVTIEEHAVQGGFGSAVLEGLSKSCASPVPTLCLGLPDNLVEHGNRKQLLHDVGLDAAGIAGRVGEQWQKIKK